MIIFAMKKVFITGIAGFIGYHLAKHLAARGDHVVGCDHFNAYYDPNLKRERVNNLGDIEVIDCDIQDRKTLEEYFAKNSITHLVHLAAQPGVRYSLTHPQPYVDSNLNGFVQILELCKAYPKTKLLFASSSSVYGLNEKRPFSESDPTDQPANLYGASKKAGELLAYSYHHLYKIPMTALRFFTVYGPWGRPDMAYYSFAKAILDGKPIPVFNNGKMERDFTFIDDIVDGILAAMDYDAPFETFNLGNNRPEKLMDMISYLENALGAKAIIDYLPMQKGEVTATWADITKSQKLLGFSPSTSLEDGINQFAKWFLSCKTALHLC